MNQTADRNIVAWDLARRTLATQLAVIRVQRKMSRKKLAKKAGVSLKVIKRCEDPTADIGKLELPVLQQIAFALGVRLKVSFESFGTLPDALKTLLSPQALRRPSFKEEFGL